MSIVNEPNDILGLAFKNLLEPYLKEKKIQKLLKNWNKVIVAEIKELYGITMTFNDGKILIEYGMKPKYDLKLIVTLDALVRTAEGRLNMISALLRRKIRVKKIYHIFTILKFYRILFPAIKKATETPALEGVVNIF